MVQWESKLAHVSGMSLPYKQVVPLCFTPFLSFENSKVKEPLQDNHSLIHYSLFTNNLVTSTWLCPFSIYKTVDISPTTLHPIYRGTCWKCSSLYSSYSKYENCLTVIPYCFHLLRDHPLVIFLYSVPWKSTIMQLFLFTAPVFHSDYPYQLQSVGWLWLPWLYEHHRFGIFSQPHHSLQ